MSFDLSRQNEQTFLEELQRFFKLNFRELPSPQMINNKPLSLLRLFTAVVNRGGADRVSELKLWKDVAAELEYSSDCSSTTFAFKCHYSKCLADYEKFFFGKPKVTEEQDLENKVNNLTSSLHPSKTDEQRLLGKQIVKPDIAFMTFYRSEPKAPQQLSKYHKKTRILSATPSAKKIVLSFESHNKEEIVRSLNILLIFSSNGNNPHSTLLFENQPYLIEGLTNYLYHCINNINQFHDVFEFLEGVKKTEAYLAEAAEAASKRLTANLSFKYFEKNNKSMKLPYLTKLERDLEKQEEAYEEQLIDEELEEATEFELHEHLQTILLIIRNMSFTKSNEPPIIKNTKLMNLLYLLLIKSNNEETKTNCLEIITNVAKHIVLADVKKISYELLAAINDCLRMNNNLELNEIALECFRRLSYPAGNEEFLEKLGDSFVSELANLLMSGNAETRERAVELLYVLSDQTNETKVIIANSDNCLLRLVGLVTSNTIDKKIPKYAACTLSNLALLPSIQKMIAPYEQELFVAATVDDSVSKIVMAVLSEL